MKEKGGARCRGSHEFAYLGVQLIVRVYIGGTAWSRRLTNSFRRYTTRCKLCSGSRSAHAKLYRWSQSPPLTRMCDRVQSKINTAPQEHERGNTASRTTQGSSWFPPLVHAFSATCLSNWVKNIFNSTAIHTYACMFIIGMLWHALYWRLFYMIDTTY